MPSNTFTLIASSTVGSGGASSISFSSIPATYTDLKIVLSVRSSNSSVNTGNYDPLGIQFNSSTSGYSAKTLDGNGNAASSTSETTITSGGSTYGRITNSGINNSNSTASTFSSVDIYIPNYLSSNQKSFSVDWTEEQNQTANWSELVAGLWTGTSAITSIGFGLANGNFVQYSTAYLYGVKSS